MEKKYLVAYGGAFDPPHFGHAACLRAALDEPATAEVLVIPSSTARYDKKSYSSDTARLEMLNIFCTELFSKEFGQRLKISSVQIDGTLPQDCYTVDLLRYLRQQNPEMPLGFLIGEDNLPQIESWKDAATLKEIVTFFVVQRYGNSSNSADLSGIKWIALGGKNDYASLSSRKIRAAIQNEELDQISRAMPDPVTKFIARNKLYLT